MNETKPIATTRVGDDATVIVLGIHYNETLRCDRKCHMLEVDDNGVLVCGLNHITNIANFQTKTLVIHYQCRLDLDADSTWQVSGSAFKVIDDEGFIHKGDMLCEYMINPFKCVEDGHTLYRGTSANIIVVYPDFPKERKVSSIVIDKSYDEKSRIDFDGTGNTALKAPTAEGIRVSETGDRRVFNPRNPGDLFERIDRLEQTVSDLQEQLRRLSEGKAAESQPTVETKPLPDDKPASDEKPTSDVTVRTVAELQALGPRDFREVVIQILHGQGFKNIETKSDPAVGFSSMIGTRFGTSYAVYAIPYSKEKPIIDPKYVQRLNGFRELHGMQKAVFFTSGKFSREAESEAYSLNVELIDKDRIAIMLQLKSEDTFGYKPLQ